MSNYPQVTITAAEEGYIVHGQHLTPEPSISEGIASIIGFRLGPNGPEPLEATEESSRRGKHTQTFAVPTLERALEVAGRLLSGASVPNAFRGV